MRVWSELQGYAGADPFFVGERNRFEKRLPETVFFAQYFATAARRYALLQAVLKGQRDRLQAAWGEALSLFAYGAHAGSAFDRVAELVGPDTPDHVRLLGWFLQHFPDEELKRLGNADSWRPRLMTLFGNSPEQGIGAELETERLFVRLMRTIGRPDIGGRFLMNRIRSAREQGDLEGIGPDGEKLRQFETKYLLWLGPLVRDFYYTISFRLTGEEGWRRHETEGYHELLDFLDNVKTTGELVGSGEVVVSDGSYTPYPALSPEEDLGAATAVYGIVDTTAPSSLLARTAEHLRAEMVSGFESWVRSSMSRTEPRPSIVPYLKLIWLEWFSQAFDGLKVETPRASEFRYSAIGASGLTDPDRVLELLHHPGTTSRLKNLTELFIETRAFLEELYP